MSGAAARSGAVHFVVFATFVAYSCVWSYPLVTLDLGTLPSRWFDAWPALWLLGRAPTIGLDLAHPASAWPLGELLTRADSYVLLALGWVTGGRLDPTVTVRLLTLLGPAVNAFAAERCAGGGYGVPRPWSLLAGLAYGFSGIAGVALLEGHVYHLLNPWLPMLWWAWRRGMIAARPGGGGILESLGWGLLVGVAFALSLATTAYFGVFATLLLGMLTVTGGTRGLRLWPGLLVIAVPAVALYVAGFVQGGGFADPSGGPDLFLREGTTTLGGLLGLTSAADAYGHSLAAPLAWAPFWLLLLSPVLLDQRSGWRVPAAVAVLALLGTLGRDIVLLPGVALVHLPLDLLARVPGVAFFRFPIRLAWVYGLCGGVVASRVLATLAEQVPRPAAWGLLLFAAVDGVVGVDLAGREGAQPVEVPSAYGTAPEGLAVLDLWGMPADGSDGEIEAWVRGLGCWYQARHGRPILELCIGTGVQSPREQVQAWLFHHLDDESEPAATLGDLGVGAIAVHARTFRETDAADLLGRLQARLGPPVTTSLDGGEEVELYLVPPPPEGAHPTDAWRRLTRR